MTDHGPSCVLWTPTFFPYGVEVLHTPMSDHLTEDGSLRIDASDSWRDRLNSPVTGVDTFWELFTIGPGWTGTGRATAAYGVDVPVAVRIDFAAGPVWMVAGIPQVSDMRKVFIPGDEIMVVFTAERMREIGFPDSAFLSRGI